MLRYEGVEIDGERYEDWLNHIAPAIMFFRSYILAHDLRIKFLTIDASGASFLDYSDIHQPLGRRPMTGGNLDLIDPTNTQSSERRIRDFVDSATGAAQ